MEQNEDTYESTRSTHTSVETVRREPSRPPVPPTVDPRAVSLYEEANAARAGIKETARTVNRLRLDAVQLTAAGAAVDSEAIANAMLAYRHLEDASMRLGKVLQALDGGVSVYDKATTVGA
jgi:hypothetical protein